MWEIGGHLRHDVWEMHDINFVLRKMNLWGTASETSGCLHIDVSAVHELDIRGSGGVGVGGWSRSQGRDSGIPDGYGHYECGVIKLFKYRIC